VRLLRKHPLGQARHEDHSERPATRLVRPADEYAAVAMPRRIELDRQQAFGDDIARLFQRDGTDFAHRPEFRENAQDAFRSTQHDRGEIRKAIQPLTPCRGSRPGGEPIDHRQRERSKVAEIPQIALERAHPRRVRILFPLFPDFQAVFLCEPVEPPVPSLRIAANDRRFDDERFPLPWRAQRSIDHRAAVIVFLPARKGPAYTAVIVLPARKGPAYIVVIPDPVVLHDIGRLLRDRTEHLVVGHDEIEPVVRGVGPGTAGFRIELRDLGEREILRETPSRELLARAGEDRQKGAAG
jgi:hypothetical protein